MDEETRNELIPVLYRVKHVSAVLEKQFKETGATDVACQLLRSYEVTLAVMKVLKDC